MYEYDLEHICSASMTLQSPPEVIGPTPDGLRLNVYVTGGEISGPKLNAKVLPVGGDWLTVRSDGVGILDIRATLETNDGAMIYLHYQGVGDAGEDGYQKFLDGDMPSTVPLRGAPRFQTAHPGYLWLNRIQCHNVGEVNLEKWTVGYDLYTVK